MNKENVQLTDEQRARIDRNFRAAKALLDRKRRSDTANSSGCYPHKIDTVNRKPLSDISSNTSTSVIRSVNGLPFSGISSNTSTSVKRSVNGVPLSGISSNTSTTFRISKTDNVYRNDSFQTPIRQINCSGKSCVTEKPNKNKVSLDSFKTPIRPFDCNVSFGVEKKELGDYGSGDGGLSYSVTPMRHESCWSSNESSTTMGTVFYEECFLAEIDQICESVKKPKLIAKESSCDIALKSVDAKTKSSELRTDVSPVAMQNLQSESDIALKSVDAKTKSSELITDVSPQNLQSENDIALKSVDAKTNSSELRTDVSPVAMQNLQSENDISLDAKTNSSELRTDVSPVAMQILQSESDSETLKIGGMPEEYEKYMNSLNDRQREAACSDISIPLMIVAGPGSGKTSTMVGRVLMLLHKGIEASNVLAMTFTTAAASEMRDRIGAVAGKAVAKALMINTFHSFSLQLCRLHAEKLNRTTDFLVYGQGQQRKAVIEALRVIESEKNLQISDSGQLCDESNVAKKGPEDFKDKSKKWLKFVAQAKASGKTFEECERSGNLIGAAILRKYEDILHKCNSLDYHDLISCSVKLLTDFPEVFKECQESWQAMVIDEFQDTSAMQYVLLRTLASHQRITIVGDEDQSIFSFNGADVSGFKSFRRDFQPHKEIRLNKNYRSTRCIVDAASFLIRNNSKRTQMNKVLTDNSSGSKIIVKECCNEAAQCLFVADKILELTSSGSSVKGTFGEIAVLYRRQVSGKVFQTAFRDRKIPFNVHGVAFYRKKVVRAIISMLRTTLVSCDDGSFRRVFKALLPLEKEEKKRIIDHINKVSTVRKCSFISAASDIFSAKISGTFKRCQLTLGRKVLVTLDIISKLAHREQSISAVITAVANMIPQKYLLEQRAVLDADGGKLLNEEHDLRSVLQYLLDDVSEFLKSYNFDMDENVIGTEEKGCVNVLTEFLDFMSERETENFRVRRHDNDHAVTLTTIHQSKGLEWDTVFIVKANENEIPLLHEYNGITKNTSASIEEERRLLYVAVTRARKKLFILYVTLDSNWQVLQPSRFLQEFPKHLLEIQDELSSVYMQGKYQECSNTKSCLIEDPQAIKTETNEIIDKICNEDSKESNETMVPFNGNDFLKRFSSEERSTVSILFNHWAKKAAFKEPKRLLDKVAFVIDERLRVKKTAQKDVLRSLKSCLKSNEAFQYAENVLKWLQIPADKRAYITREKQEHFQKLRIEKSMGSSEPTTKQIAYLQSLGCTTIPTSRLHASTLIEQYKKL